MQQSTGLLSEYVKFSNGRYFKVMSKVFLFLTRVILGVSALIGLYIIILPLAYVVNGSVPRSNSWYSVGIGFLLLYFLYCLVCSIAVRGNRLFLISGFGMNIIVVLTFFSFYSHIGSELLFAVPAYFVLLTGAVYAFQVVYENQLSVNRSDFP